MANRKRDVQILLWVTPEEKKMIRKRMILSKTSNMSVYLRKMAIDGMIVNAPDKKAYQKQHQAEYQLHDTTLQELSGLGIKKLPSQEKLQKQLQQLETELAATQKELTQLQADQRTLHIVQSNFSSMLQDADILPELSSENPEQSI